MSVKVRFFSAGYCTHPEKMLIKGGSSEECKFHALFALIEHPKEGYILFDTGYSDQFFSETSNFPFNIYAKLTPVCINKEDCAVYQLKQIGIKPEEIKLIILSHFHADHIGGIKDFPNSKVLCFKSSYNEIKHLKGLYALKSGFLPGLLSKNFTDKVIFTESFNKITLPDHLSPFKLGFDIFSDGSIISVDLDGHSKGQQGIIINTKDKSYFLVGDACWLSRSYKDFIEPHPLANLIFSNPKRYQDNLKKLNTLYKKNPNIQIIPSHCPEVWKELVENG